MNAGAVIPFQTFSAFFHWKAAQHALWRKCRADSWSWGKHPMQHSANAGGHLFLHWRTRLAMHSATGALPTHCTETGSCSCFALLCPTLKQCKPHQTLLGTEHIVRHGNLLPKKNKKKKIEDTDQTASSFLHRRLSSMMCEDWSNILVPTVSLFSFENVNKKT